MTCPWSRRRRGGFIVAASCALALLGAACATTTTSPMNDRRTAPDEPWRAARPPSGPLPITPLPTFQKFELKNGLTVIVAEDHSLPTIDAAVVVRAGSVLDGRESGLAQLTWALIDEGAGSLNAAALDNAFADIGSQLSSSGGRESGTVDARFLTQHADKALELIALILQKPTFAAADFERVKTARVTLLKARAGDPDAVADDVFAAAAYGADHPYGQPLGGTPGAVEKLKIQSVKRFWSDNVGPKTAALLLAGDVTLEDARALAEKHFGRWRGSAKPSKPPAAPKARAGLQLVVVDVPGATQTQVRVGRPVLSAGDSDEPALIVLNAVVGGMFSSRLNLKLRKEKKWTYQIRSALDAQQVAGAFVIDSAIETAHTVDAVVAVLDELKALRTSGITAAELALGRAFYSRSLPALSSLPPQQVALAAGFFDLGLPLDHHAKLFEGVNAATLEHVHAAAERALVEDDLVVVLVGDRAAFEPALRERNLGTLTFINRDGAPRSGDASDAVSRQVRRRPRTGPRRPRGRRTPPPAASSRIPSQSTATGASGRAA